FALAARAAPRVRYAWLGLGAAEAMVLLATGSRGGIAAFLVVLVGGAVALFLRARKVRSREKTPPSRRLELGMALGLSLAMGAVLAYDGIASELSAEQEDSKIVLLERGAALALAAPPLGLGRGAFGQAIAETFPYDRRVEFAENLLIQRIADWGMPFSFFVLLAISIAFARGAMRRRSLLGIAAALGLTGLALQNLVDFSLELPGVSIPAAIALAVVVSTGRAGHPSAPLHPALAGALTVAVFGVAFLLGPFMPARTADAQLATLRALAPSSPEPPLDAIGEALSLHPRDPAIALTSAHLVRRSRP